MTLPGAEVLREARTQAGLSRRALAAKAGVPTSTVSRIENEQSDPTLSMLDRLLTAADRRLAIEASPRADRPTIAELATATDGMTPQRQRYDSPVRRQQLAETRERILTAGAAVAREITTWDWSGLTFRAVAQRAGVSERTVYRHFATERELRDAVMGRLEQEAGVSYEGLTLDDLAEVAALVFSARASFAPPPVVMDDPTFIAEDDLRKGALREAVTAVAPDWTEIDREKAAGVLDLLWHVPSFERLVDHWGLDADHATAAITWALDLIAEAIRAGIRPVPLT